MLTDGVAALRPSTAADKAALIALRDERFRRFIGEGSDDPSPTFVVTVAGDDAVVGWVDADRNDDEHTWLAPHEVNIGYALHRDVRGRGVATRSVMLLLHHLAQTAPHVRTATLAINADNDRSLSIARRCGFRRGEDLPRSTFWTKPVPAVTYTDGVVTIRPFDADRDFERDMEAKDEEQRRWLWLPEHREHWAAMTDDERIAHNRRTLAAHRDDPGTGPKWSFVIDVGGQYCGHVDCDLANPNVPRGEANISYSSHPAVRGKGYVSRGVRLILRFVAEHTGAREAHLVANPDNVASVRVASAVAAFEVERYRNERGDTMVRHVIEITRSFLEQGASTEDARRSRKHEGHPSATTS